MAPEQSLTRARRAVLDQVARKELTPSQGAAALGISKSWFYALRSVTTGSILTPCHRLNSDPLLVGSITESVGCSILAGRRLGGWEIDRRGGLG